MAADHHLAGYPPNVIPTKAAPKTPLIKAIGLLRVMPYQYALGDARFQSVPIP
jgi:hypothetical protein